MGNDVAALGIDVGALYLKLVMTDGDGGAGSTKYVAIAAIPCSR